MPVSARSKYLQTRYGITESDYNAILKKQGGICAICYFAPRPGTRRLAVDHDHRTKVVRGLLCSRCNRGLAWWRDNPTWLESAARYLRRGPVKP
jgi:hypothetical protein